MSESGENKQCIPESLLDKIFEFTHNGQNGGFILAYVDNEGNVCVNCKISSQVVELGLRKSLERFLDSLEINENTLNLQDNNQQGQDELE